jgi:hypothetical protein
MQSASASIDQKIQELADWRGKTLARIRAILHEADPGIVEEWKWVKPTEKSGGKSVTGDDFRRYADLALMRKWLRP